MKHHAQSSPYAQKGRSKKVVAPPVEAEIDPRDAPPNCANSNPTKAGVLVLNHNFEPLNVCGLKRGLVLMLLNKAEVIRFSDVVIHSVDEEIYAPSVLRLNQMVKRPTPRLKMSRRSVLARDDHTCQYCGSKSNLTIDHVFPRHRGGESTWENLVCCCLRCNNKKGDKTPQEIGMRLPYPPRRPNYTPYISFPRFVSALRQPDWREFLEMYGKGLER